jgi:hypothetical protein
LDCELHDAAVDADVALQHAGGQDAEDLGQQILARGAAVEGARDDELQPLQ